MDYKIILKDIFGFDSLRPFQKDVVEAIKALMYKWFFVGWIRFIRIFEIYESLL